MNSVRQHRHAQGLGAIYSLSEAARLLPVSDARARRWLRDEGLVSTICGREVVVWARVVEALAATGDQQPPERRVARAPHGLRMPTDWKKR